MKWKDSDNGDPHSLRVRRVKGQDGPEIVITDFFAHNDWTGTNEILLPVKLAAELGRRLVKISS